jgi:hypothetical protein
MADHHPERGQEILIAERAETRSAKPVFSSRLLLAVALLLLASAVLLIYALYLPHASFPTFRLCTPRMTVSSCTQMIRQEIAEIAAAKSYLWLHPFCVEVAEGFAAVALLLLVFSRWKIPEDPKSRNRLLSIFGVVFACLFFLLAFGAHIGYWVWADLHIASALSLRIFLYSILSPVPGPPSNGLGVVSFIYFSLACLCFVLRYGVKTTLFRFAAPSVFILMLCILVLDMQEMSLHITNFLTPLTYDGVDLVSNWLALMVSGFIVLYSCPWQALKEKL